MTDSRLETLHQWAAAFRSAIEATRAERSPGALPYFPDGACRMASRLFGKYLFARPDAAAFGRAQLVSGVVPGSEHGARHFWLELHGVIVDLTADAFGERPVVVGLPTAFHESLTARSAEDMARVLASLSADETDRLARQLAVIETRLSPLPSPAV